MAEVTNELMFELLKRIQADTTDVRQSVGELRREVNVIRGHMVAIQADIHNIYGIMGRHDERLDRIERRLELRELAEKSQSPYEPPKS